MLADGGAEPSTTTSATALPLPLLLLLLLLLLLPPLLDPSPRLATPHILTARPARRRAS